MVLIFVESVGEPAIESPSSNDSSYGTRSCLWSSVVAFVVDICVCIK